MGDILLHLLRRILLRVSAGAFTQSRTFLSRFLSLKKHRSSFSPLKLERACKQVRSTFIARIAFLSPFLETTHYDSKRVPPCLVFRVLPRKSSRDLSQRTLVGLRNRTIFSLLALAAMPSERTLQRLLASAIAQDVRDRFLPSCDQVRAPVSLWFSMRSRLSCL